MDCNKCYYGVAESGGRQACGYLLLSGETWFVHDGKINQKCPKESDPSEADLKHLLSRTVPYLRYTLAEAETRHEQTLELYFYEKVKDLSDLLDKIEAALKGETP